MLNKVAIILVNYNGKKYLEDCVCSILQSTYKDYSIIIIDNNSSDGSIELIEAKYRNIIIIKQYENLGFAKANNIAAKYAISNGAEYIMLLNNDTVIDSDAISYLINRGTSECIAVPKIYYFTDKNRLWYAGGEIKKNKGVTYHYGEGEIDKGQYDNKEFITFASGCCMLIHRDIIYRIGLFDEKYFMYCEDADFCMNALLNDIKIVFEPKAVIWHKVSSTSGGGKSAFVIYYTSRNRLYFVKKFKVYFGHIGWLYSVCFLFLRLFKGILARNNAIIIWKAFKDYYKKVMYRQNDL